MMKIITIGWMLKNRNIEQQHQLLPLSSWRIKLFDDVQISVIDTSGHIDGYY